MEGVIAGSDLVQIVADKKYSKYKDYLLTDGDEPYFRVRRSPKEEEIEQNGKKVKLDGKKAPFWNPNTQQFENPSGIDALFKSLVDLVPVLADTTTSDIVDFGSTKTLGKLISVISHSFQKSPKWKAFQDAHATAFSDGEESLSSLTEDVTNQVESLVQTQYGAAKVRLDFTLPDATTFIKGGQLLVTDGKLRNSTVRQRYRDAARRHVGTDSGVLEYAAQNEGACAPYAPPGRARNLAPPSCAD